jgi:hypothetical protein
MGEDAENDALVEGVRFGEEPETTSRLNIRWSGEPVRNFVCGA